MHNVIERQEKIKKADTSKLHLSEMSIIAIESWSRRGVLRSFKHSSSTSLRFIIILLIGSIFNVMLAVAGGHAEDEPLDLKRLSIEKLMEIEVATVYGASKYEQKVMEAPSSISIVTAEDIKHYGYRTLADIVRSLRGFIVTNDRNYSYLSTRGFGRTGDYNSRILILVDGHRINENVYDSAYIDEGFIIDVDLIERLEVIRGPSSSLYGNNAFFAVINIITRSGQDLKGVEISGTAGSFDTYTGRLSLGNRFDNGMKVIISSSILDSNGQDLFFKEFNNPATNNGIALGCDYGRNYSLFSKLSYHDFTLEGAYVSREKGIPTASFDTDFNDSRNKTVDELGYINLEYEHIFENQLRVLVQISYNNYKYRGDYLYDGVTNKDFIEGEWWIGDVLLSKEIMKRHKVAVGAEYQVNSKQNQENYNNNPFERIFDDKRKSKAWSLYIQDEFTILNNLISSMGLRHDHFDTFGSTTNPRLALIYSPFEKTTFKFIYGTAFRAPNVYELYFNAYPNKGNIDLQPEKIKTYEMVYEQYLGNNLHLTTAGFYNKMTDLIDQQTDPLDNLLVFRNISEVKAKGVEVELEGKLSNGIRGRISYTFQDAEDDKTGKTLVNSPKHLAKMNLLLPILREKLLSGIEVQYTSKRKTFADEYADAFFVTNLTVFSQKLIKGLEISGSIYNLFDKNFDAPGSLEHRQDTIEQDGRTFRFKLTFKF